MIPTCSTSRPISTRSFPGTGRAREIGGPKAPGLTVNIPLPAGATGDVVRAAIDHVARPTIEEFSPDWVLVSCGFDAHQADPLGDLALSSGDFAELARMVNEFTPRPGRLALFLEGGYNHMALQMSVTDTLGALLGLHTHPAAPTYGGPGMNEIRVACNRSPSSDGTHAHNDVERGGRPMNPSPTIVVGYDGSVDSTAALRWAARLTRAIGGRLRIVHAVGLLEHAGLLADHVAVHRETALRDCHRSGRRPRTDRMVRGRR